MSAWKIASFVTPSVFSASAAGARPPSAAIARNTCSVLVNSSLSRSASCSAAVDDVTQPRRQARLRAALDVRQFVDERLHGRRQLGGVDVHLAEHGRDDAVGLLEQREQQMLGLNFGVPARSASCCAARIASCAFSVY